MRFRLIVFAILLMALASAGAQQAPATMSMPNPGTQAGRITSANEDTFGPIAGLPSCMTGSVQNGDPGSGPFVVLLKASSGCTVPMHWHSASEQLMFVDGAALFQMSGDQPHAISAGSYVYGPAKHPHQITCSSDCMLYVTSDGPFDIHYIDSSGNEIPSPKALSEGR